jgi:hypothetical protein
MARKKTVPIDPEIFDSELEETQQLHEEGETPAGDIPADALPGDEPAGEGSPDSELPLDGDTPVVSEGVPPFEERDTDVEAEAAAVDLAPEGISPEPEAAAPGEDDYGAILQEMGYTAPAEETPLMLDTDTGQEPPGGEDGETLPAENISAADRAGLGDTPPRPVPSPASSARRERVLTIDAHDEVQTQEDRDDIIWHEVQNAYRTRRILTGTLDGIERTDSGYTLAVVSYKGFRVAIPIKEMMLHTGPIPEGVEYVEWMDQLQRILSSRLGSELDFVVKGIENKSRSIVASRREAMFRKRKTFYMDANELGEHMIYEGRVVQARVVAVAEKMIRVEVFGVECSIVARGLSWLWIGSARDHFSVGDRILVRVLKIDRTDVEHLSIQVDARSVLGIDSGENLKKCQPQSRYAGRVTDVRKGVVFIRLNNGVNAIAHSCYDLRTPGKKDDVSFAVTHLDEEQGVAVGIITRIIKQNL